ncbi:MAG: hypothetical protein JNJ60_14920 [Rhodocyclaceae bacterium]|nr:hypothetical protein [Rhodocyclaceae bacterium]
MQRVNRPKLPGRAQAYLDGKWQATNGTLNIEPAWKSARQTQTMRVVLQTLQNMAGARERCMYCVDSHGSDIEHFWPKGPYPERAFLWPNLLLCCSECGRFKGSQFPLSGTGQPMLVDPSAENPWDHLDFDPDTGNLTARYDVAIAAPSPRGECTVRVLQLDRREAMAEGYRRTYRRIAARVEQALAADAIEPQALAEELRQADEHGLLGWCFSAVGARLKPFGDLRRRAPDAWAACEAAGK